jgi:formylglycine-generating enzyme required for sulfatase activity
MAGLPTEDDDSPYERDHHDTGFAEHKFAWGKRWPPMRDSGNFADTSAQIHVPQDLCIELYRDGFPYTAPVGSFPANTLGLHDLSGNVQEWVSDNYGGPEELELRHHGTTRGGDYTSFSPSQLHLGHRVPQHPTSRTPTVGFRLMLERK